MKLCPKCGTQYPDDANFCHVDAGRLVFAEIEEAAASAEASSQDGTRTEPVDAGARILGDRFELGERMGGRQTGDVYEALDRTTGKACVVKVVDEEVFPRSLLMQRTERELGKLMRLDASGIARVLGYGKEESRLWIANERVPDSRSLLDIVFDEGPMPIRRAAEIVVQVGKSLSEAAKVGVIHRDLAPKNVLLQGGGTTKLINYGVAVPTTDKVHGVPEFVAPEIVEGRPVDQRANIYSLGALFYYLITGRPPYMGDPEAVYAGHLSGEPEPPSTHLEGIPDDVDVVILRALARSSSKRFMTLRQLLNDVERLAAGEEPMSAMPAMAGLAPRGKRKSRKLAQTMLGGHQVAAALSARAGNGQGAKAAEASGSRASSEPAGDGATTAPAAAAGTLAGGEVAPPDRAAASADGAPETERQGRERADSGSDADVSGPREDEGAPQQVLKSRGKKKPGFRETQWFKEGSSAARKGGLAIEERYQDDGTVSDGDQDRFSLKTGATDVMASVRGEKKGALEEVSSEELAREMKKGRGLLVALLVVILLLIGAIAAVVMLSDG